MLIAARLIAARYCSFHFCLASASLLPEPLAHRCHSGCCSDLVFLSYLTLSNVNHALLPEALAPEHFHHELLSLSLLVCISFSRWLLNARISRSLVLGVLSTLLSPIPFPHAQLQTASGALGRYRHCCQGPPTVASLEGFAEDPWQYI